MSDKPDEEVAGKKETFDLLHQAMTSYYTALIDFELKNAAFLALMLG
jgi:hypothetical protein